MLTSAFSDDIIKYLAPSLEPYKGCSIIDIHPGACLFSSKIHEHLKPKRHILMEPEARYVEPFIQPLLDQPNSAYRYTPLAGAHPKSYFQSYQEILGDGNLLPRPGLPAGDPKLRELDPSLLVIGNVDRAFQMQNRLDLASLMMHQMPYSALSNQLFQRAGLVRMLWWIPERVVHQCLSRGPLVRSSFSTGIEMGTEINEVAGTVSVNDMQSAAQVSRKRADLFDHVNAQQVAQRMKQSGISVPKDRELLRVSTEEPATKGAHKSIFEDKITKPVEMLAKIDKMRARLNEVPRIAALKDQVPKRKGMLALNQSVEYPQCQVVVDSYRERKDVSRTRGPIFLDLQLQVMNLEFNYQNLKDADPTNPALETLRHAILTLDDDIHAVAVSVAVHQLWAISALNEEQLSFYQTPQLLPLDRRRFEPLKLSPTDFFPPTSRLALLDLVPKTRDLSVPDLASSREAATVCAEMLRQLYAAKSKPVIEALDTFAVNAGQDLVPQVPAIYDVRRGGRLNPQRVSVRALTDGMVEGLVKAFFEWPFRPGTREVMGGADDVGPEVDEEGEGKDVVESEDSSSASDGVDGARH